MPLIQPYSVLVGAYMLLVTGLFVWGWGVAARSSRVGRTPARARWVGLADRRLGALGGLELSIAGARGSERRLSRWAELVLTSSDFAYNRAQTAATRPEPKPLSPRR